MLLCRRTCKFPGCDWGKNGGAYRTLEDLNSEELTLKDMKLHVGTSHMETCPIGNNHKEWIKQQVEPNPVIQDLHIMVDKNGYKELGYHAPARVCTIVE